MKLLHTCGSGQTSVVLNNTSKDEARNIAVVVALGPSEQSITSWFFVMIEGSERWVSGHGDRRTYSRERGRKF
jgi:hypothetical protein